MPSSSRSYSVQSGVPNSAAAAVRDLALRRALRPHGHYQGTVHLNSTAGLARS